MDNETELIDAWAASMHIGSAAASELERQLALINPLTTHRILDAVTNSPESPIAYCATSIVKAKCPVHRGGTKHLSLSADSLIALVPYLASTYASFDFQWNTDFTKVSEIFSAVLDAASFRFDVPMSFVFDPDVDSEMLSYMRGRMIGMLTMSYSDGSDAEWLGEHSEALAPHSMTMYERGDSSREFCERLLAANAPAVSAGVL